MPRIFLAHAAFDRRSAERLADALRKRGQTAWVDEDELPSGVSIPGAIARGLRGADGVAVVVSRRAVESGWLEAELTLAPPSHFSGRVVPVLLEDAPLPASLNEIACVELFGSDSAALEAGIDALVRLFVGYEGEAGAEKAPFPPNNLPRRRLFVGREDALGVLGKGGNMTVVDALHLGFGGLGKSALLLEYAHQHGGSFPGGVWWLEARGEPSFVLAQLADELRAAAPLPVREALAELAPDAPAAEVAAVVRRALEGQKEATLLVLDDAEPDRFREHLPDGEVRVILSARPGQGAIGELLPLGPLSMAEAKAMAELFSGPPQGADDEQALGRVVFGALGGLPLAIEAAARVVRESHRSWARYEAELGARAVLLEEEARLYGGYAPSVLAAIDRSIERCSTGDVSRHVLEAAAVFAPSAVPLEWVGAAAVLDADDTEWRQALRVLRGLGLLTIDRLREVVSMHQLVHLRVRRRVVGAAEWRRIRAHAAEVVARWLEEESDFDARAEREIGARMEHLQEVLAAADRAGEELLFKRIAERIAVQLELHGQKDEASWLQERAAAMTGAATS